MEAVARCIDDEPADLERLTLAQVRHRWGRRRLTTTEWQCQRCSAKGIEDALRGLYVQFLCLRGFCNFDGARTSHRIPAPVNIRNNPKPVGAAARWASAWRP